jgi:hypothetical protein
LGGGDFLTVIQKLPEWGVSIGWHGPDTFRLPGEANVD